MSPRGIHLFLGPDRAGKLQRIQAIERSLTVQPLDRHHLDGAHLSGAELLALCRQQPAMSPLRLVVVDQAHKLDQKCVAALLQHAEVIAQTACLVLLVETELSARHALTNLTVPTERFVGHNAAAAKPFALTDALGTRDTASALSSLHDQLLAGKEPLELLGLVVWQLHRWVWVKRLLASGWSEERIAQVTGLRPWQVQRVQGEVARRPLESLQRLLERCWEVDVDAKSGRTAPELAVETLVVEICRG